MEIKVIEKISLLTDFITSHPQLLSKMFTIKFTLFIKTFTQLQIINKKLLMFLKNSNLLDFLQFLPRDSANANIVVSKDVKAVSSLMINKKLSMTSPQIKEKKSKWNSIGEKKISKSKKFLIILKIQIWAIKTRNYQRKKQELQFKIASNYFKNHKF